MDKRPLVTLLLIALASITLSACGGGAETGPEPTVTPAVFTPPQRFVPTATPGAVQVAEPLGLDDAIQVESAALKVVPPGECHLVENLAEPNRLGSARAFDYKLRYGFGCPSSDGNLRLEEVQFHTASSLAAYDSQCASGSCDANRTTPADFDAQLTALQTGQAVAGWALLDVGGRSVLTRSVPIEGAPAVMRQYAEYCGNVRVENRLVILGDDPTSLESSADSFYATVALTCQPGA